MSNDTPKTSAKLTQFLSLIPDPRRRQGRRYSLVQILMIVVYGSANGCSCIASCQEKAKSNLAFFSKELGLKSIPDQTTIIRVLAKVNVGSLTQVVEKFLNIKSGFYTDQALSVDGKTLCGVHGVKVRHILSLFTHLSKRTICQLGITDKTNEIGALKKLLIDNQDHIFTKIITGDAIFAQKDICNMIVGYGSDYLVRLKDNQEFLRLEVRELFNLGLISTQTYNSHSSAHGKRQIVQVEVSSDLNIFHDNLRLTHIYGWHHIKTIGKVTTTAKRLKSTDGYMGNTSYQDQNSSCYFISSRRLSAKSAHDLLKSHWSIENHLHRHKDMIFMEDRQTLRSGFAHEIMTFIRSFCIYLLYQVSPTNLAQGFREFNYHPRLVQNYFRKAHLI